MNEIPKDELREFQLLSEIEKSPHLSQRTLSKRLGIALGLTNLCIKRLVKKGYIKISNVDNRRINYLITPEGIAEKTRLSYEYLKSTISFFGKVRKIIVKDFQKLEAEGHRKLVFYGAGEEAEIAYISLHQTDLSLVGVVDDERHGEQLFGYLIMEPHMVSDLDFDVVVVVTFEKNRERRDALIELGVEPEHILMLGG